MQRTKWWLLWWLLLYLVSHNIGYGDNKCKSSERKDDTKTSEGTGSTSQELLGGEKDDKDLENYKEDLSESGIKKKNTERTSSDKKDVFDQIGWDNKKAYLYPDVVFLLQKPNGPFKGLNIQASENEASSDRNIPNAKVNVQLPRELDAGPNNTIAFCLLTWQETNMTTSGASDELYENTIVGLSVRHKKISGLRECVNITMILNIGINETRVPRCVFYNVTTRAFSSSGCLTRWERGQDNITCSCDHLTYFGVLMVGETFTTNVILDSTAGGRKS